MPSRASSNEGKPTHTENSDRDVLSGALNEYRLGVPKITAVAGLIRNIGLPFFLQGVPARNTAIIYHDWASSYCTIVNIVFNGIVEPADFSV